MKILIRSWIVVTVLVALGVVPMLSVSAREDLVHLVLWHSKQDAQADALQALINAFQSAHPKITIETLYLANGTLQEEFATSDADQRPDMILAAGDNVGLWASAGLVKDLSVTIPEILKAQVSATAWELFQFNDGLYAVPYSTQTLGFFYNKTFVQVAPATWADVLSSAKQIHTDHANVTGLAFQNGFFQSAGFLFALGGQLMDFDGNIAFGDDGDGAQSMDAYLQFQQDMSRLGQDASSGVIVDASSPNPSFSNGSVAMIYDGLWNLAQYETDLGDNLGVSIMPALDNGVVPAMFAQGDGFYLNTSADEAKTQAFIDWGKYVTSALGQAMVVKQTGLLSVNPAVKLDDPNFKTFADQLALGTPFPNRPEIAQFWAAMTDAITAVTVTGTSPDQARHHAYVAIQQALHPLDNATPESEATLEATTSP